MRTPLHRPSAILVALAAGALVGLAINAWWPEGREPGPAIAALAGLCDFVGALFMRGLQFVAVPIVLFSLIGGVAGLGDPRRLGRLGVKTLGLYLFTTAVAVVLGMTIANAVRPGAYVSAEARDALLAEQAERVSMAAANTGRVASGWDQLLALVPRNPFAAIAEGQMLQVIVFAVVTGIGLTLLPAARGRPVAEGFTALGEAFGRLVQAFMFIAPFAVFCLILPIVATTGRNVLQAMGVYILCVLAGMLLIALVEYPLLLRLLAGVRPGAFFRGIAPALPVAFSTSSSNATLPVTLEAVTTRLGVPRRVASFVLPLGATVNMDGTALYQGLATVFIAQAMGVELSLAAQASVVLTAVLASIGTPGIPGAGTVMLIVILQAAGVPEAGVALVLGVDRPLDMCRTVVNVAGDAAVCAIVARGEGEDPADEKEGIALPANPYA